MIVKTPSLIVGLTVLLTVYSIAQLPELGIKNQVFINSKGTTYNSTDYGMTWIKEVNESKSVDFKIQRFINSKGTTYISNDYGMTWTKEKTNGIDQVKAIKDFIVSPNPAFCGEGINITFHSSVNAKATIQILDIASNEKLSEIINDISEGFNSKHIKLMPKFVTGAYYIQMKIENKLVYSGKFIIQ